MLLLVINEHVVINEKRALTMGMQRLFSSAVCSKAVFLGDQDVETE